MLAYIALLCYLSIAMTVLLIANVALVPFPFTSLSLHLPLLPPLQLRREKIDLENTLEQEQEMLVNKLWKKMDRVEAEKRWVCSWN